MMGKPKLIEVQTLDWCNRACWFCPNASGMRKTRRRMTMHTWNLILRDLVDWEWRGQLWPSLLDEPLMDDRLVDFVWAAKRALPECSVMVESNGDALGSARKRRQLAESALDGIRLSAYDGMLGMEGVVRVWCREYERVVRVDAVDPARLDGSLQVEIRNPEERLGKFWNRAGNAPAVTGPRSLLMCELPFRQMYINWAGTAVQCCGDWGYETNQGNVHEERLWDIWNGTAYRALRDAHLERRWPDLPLCGRCDRLARPGTWRYWRLRIGAGIARRLGKR